MSEMDMPRLNIALSLFIIPTLIISSEIIGRSVLSQIIGYSRQYSKTLSKHLVGEFEVQLIDGKLTDASQEVLDRLENEMEILQYRDNLVCILDKWADHITGHPVYPEVHNVICIRVEEILDKFRAFILRIQKHSIAQRRGNDNILCRKVCSSKTRIINLTGFPIPSLVEELFQDGPNSVPQEARPFETLKQTIERDLIKASISFFRSNNYFYPVVTETNGLKSVIEQLLAQSPSNSKSVQFFCHMYEQFSGELCSFESSLSSKHFESESHLSKVLPAGTILSLADKGLGLVLLPIDWYIKQYKVQSIKGGHIQTRLSNEQCLLLLKQVIETFRSSLEDEEKSFLLEVFSKPFSKPAVGLLKLVAKIHKVEKLDENSYNDIPSRPIRGAENCPINPYSKALCKLLQNLHCQVKIRMGHTYPIILGCDEYSNKIQQVEYPAAQCSSNTLLSADFSDAYTKSNLLDLQGALDKLGTFCNWPIGKISLCKKLSKIVFENCYFETPTGIQRQSQGFPMGGHSSREGLDTILLCGELDLLQAEDIKSSLYYYHRLVDDISAATCGKFTVLRSLVQKMAEVYPSSMPLNIQISFGYSHFLDSHVCNMLQPSPTNKLTTSIAYKPLSRFDYVPFSSNIHPKYKGKDYTLCFH